MLICINGVQSYTSRSVKMSIEGVNVLDTVDILSHQNDTIVLSSSHEEICNRSDIGTVP